MTKPISRRQHGVIEYSYITATALAPRLVGFENEPAASLACRAFSGAAFVTTLFTRAEWGAIRVLPYKAHVAIDIVSGVAALATPWLLGFSGSDRARNTFLTMGLSAVVVGLLSEPEEMP